MSQFPLRKSPNLSQLNADIQDFWKRSDTFKATIAEREGSSQWVFYEGPPSANGTPGIHHVMGRSLKDLYCRYQTQLGKQVARRAGWDTHGLPVELAVEKSLGITKEDIGQSVSVEQYNQECRQAVMRYSAQWRELTERIGYWVDMDDPYVTYESKYMESVWWLLSQIFNKGSLYRGHTIQPYSPMAGTGLSTHELNQPGAYQDVTDLSATAMFRVRAVDAQAEARAAARVGGLEVDGAQVLNDSLVSGALKDTELFLLAWTTTPWTLPSNTALAVNASFEYALVETFNRYTGARVTVIAAQGLINEVFADGYEPTLTGPLAWDGNPKSKIPYSIRGTVKGSALVGLWYEQLVDWLPPAETPERAFRVIAASFVTLESGTGIVHIAPTFGADDARVAAEANIPPMLVKDEEDELVPLVDGRGRLVSGCGDLAGKYVKLAYYSDGAPDAVNVDEALVLRLKQQGRLFRSLKYKHSYPHCWRTDKPVIYYPLKSWFIKTTDYKSELIDNNRKVQWFPESTGTGRFGEWLEKLADWNLSRSRFWGIPLPIWSTEDGKETLCIGSFAELKGEIGKAIAAGVMTEDPFADFVPNDFDEQNYAKIDVHRPFIDRVKLVAPSGAVMTRETDVIDVWFDSGSMPYAQVHYPFENRELVDDRKEFPADFIAEGVDQARGWFFTLHTIATLVFGSVAFKHVLSNGLVLDAEGRKMSKRLGNAVDPIQVLDKYGADPLRWYMVTNSPPWQNLRFDLAGLEETVRKFYGTLWSTYSFFATYANADGFTGEEEPVPLAARPELDRWILSELALTVGTARKALDAFDATRGYRAVQSFLIDSLSNWYIRLNRRRFWKAEMGEDKLSAYQTAFDCLMTLAKLIAPVSPFHAEQLYQDLTTKTRHLSKVSVHLTDFPELKSELVDEALNDQMRATRAVASLALSLRKDKKLKVRQPLATLTVIASENVRSALEFAGPILREEVNVKSVELASLDSEIIERSAQLNFREAGPRFGKQTKAVAAAIKALSNSALTALTGETSLKLEVDGQILEVPTSLVKLNVRGKEGAELATDGTLTVVLDTQVTEELRTEGFARELVSAIQKLRKEAGFEVTTRIHLTGQDNPSLKQALEQHREYVCAETLCEVVELVSDLSSVTGIEISGTELKLDVRAV